VAELAARRRGRHTGLMYLDLVKEAVKRWVLRSVRRPDRDGGRQGGRHHPARPEDQIRCDAASTWTTEGISVAASFLIRAPTGCSCCACGAPFSRQNHGRSPRRR